jgi:hypothetical protein
MFNLLFVLLLAKKPKCKSVVSSESSILSTIKSQYKTSAGILKIIPSKYLNRYHVNTKNPVTKMNIKKFLPLDMNELNSYIVVISTFAIIIFIFFILSLLCYGIGCCCCTFSCCTCYCCCCKKEANKELTKCQCIFTVLFLCLLFFAAVFQFTGSVYFSLFSSQIGNLIPEVSTDVGLIGQNFAKLLKNIGPRALNALDYTYDNFSSTAEEFNKFYYDDVQNKVETIRWSLNSLNNEFSIDPYCYYWWEDPWYPEYPPEYNFACYANNFDQRFFS